MASTVYSREISKGRGQDPAYMEAININMRVPERLSVGPGQQWRLEEGEEAPPAYTMQVPDRLTYTEAPDMSPRPLFTPSKPIIGSALRLEPCWEGPSGEVFYRDGLQSPIRRSYSDQSFGRTPPGTPTQLVLHRNPSTSCSQSTGRPVHQRPTSSLSAQPGRQQAQPLPPPPLSVLSSQSLLQAACQLGLQASQRLLQTVHKYRHNSPTEDPAASVVAEVSASADGELSGKKRTVDNWVTEDEGGAGVEFIVLRRQVLKMSRRLAALERSNVERRNTEVVLFSLLFSACLLNVWLWIRR